MEGPVGSSRPANVMFGAVWYPVGSLVNYEYKWRRPYNIWLCLIQYPSLSGLLEPLRDKAVILSGHRAMVLVARASFWQECSHQSARAIRPRDVNKG